MEAQEYATLRRLEDHFWWYRGLHAIVLDRVFRFGRPDGQAQVLDAGCGTGGMLRRLRSRLPEAAMMGIDFSPHALAHAHVTEPTTRLCRGSVEAVPAASDRFDLVVSLDVLYHAGVTSDAGAVRELARTLRPGGCLVLNLPAFEALRSSHDRAIHTARRYRRSGVEELLRQAGLEPVRVDYWNGFLFPALAAVRWLRRKDVEKDGPPPESDVRPLPGPINATLTAALAVERFWLRFGRLPFGLSVLAVGRKPQP